MADDPKAAIEALQAEQETLQEKHDRAQTGFHAARTKYGKAKDALVAFNTKYGRMLKMVVVDPEAEEEEAPAEEPEIIVVPEEPEEPAGGFPDAIDTSAEE